LADIEVEFVIGPFQEGEPGEHVTAAIEAMTAAGLDVEMGAFATTVRGDVEVVAEAVRAMIVRAVNSGANRLNLHVQTPS
jgi:uncharacterized protein YqgV (UPF0045/DUF77 family)